MKAKHRTKRIQRYRKMLGIIVLMLTITLIGVVVSATVLYKRKNACKTPDTTLVEYMMHIPKQEYEEILFNKYKHLPDVSEFKYYSECKKMFLEIPLEEAYLSVLKLLKKRSQIIKDEFSKIPYELKFLAYFMNLKSDDYKKITKFLNESYGGV